MRRLLLLSFVLSAAVAAQPAQERHSEVLLRLPADATLPEAREHYAARLAAHGLILDHAHLEQGPDGLALRTVLSETELSQAYAAGVEIEVLVDDLAAEISARPPFTAAQRAAARAGGSVQGNVFGSMGGYPTYDEIVVKLDSMHLLYPDLISEKVSLGQSHEGRDIWMVEISDNPGTDEFEPEALYTAIHHAREPQGAVTVLYFMYFLLEQYGMEDRVTQLVDERRLFFVPVLNPDGYVYNETTNPDGGGFWRKNRRDNGDGSFGVDPNRNYSYEWGYDDVGSSPNPSSGGYRGPEPFSEPETAALRDFLESGRRVSQAFNYHTYSNLLLYSWTYEEGLYTPDSARFVQQAQELTAMNGYTYGTSPDVLYEVNGGSDDWMYGEQTTKPKILAYTPEVGGFQDGFWPDPSRIIPLAEENLEANVLLAEFAELFVVAIEQDDPIGVEPYLGPPSPNPFNPATELALDLREAAPVRLAVYDALGREVAVLMDGPRPAGRHVARFDAEAQGLPSGVYFVRLTTPEGSASRRLLLVK